MIHHVVIVVIHHVVIVVIHYVVISMIYHAVIVYRHSKGSKEYVGKCTWKEINRGWYASCRCVIY